jgi:hypothetical protein
LLERAVSKLTDPAAADAIGADDRHDEVSACVQSPLRHWLMRSVNLPSSASSSSWSRTAVSTSRSSLLADRWTPAL